MSLPLGPAAIMASFEAFLETWGPFLLILLAAAVWGLFFDRIVVRGLMALARRLGVPAFELFVRAIQPALVLVAAVWALWTGLKYFGARLPDEIVRWTQLLGVPAVVLVFALVATRLLTIFLQSSVKKRARLTGVASLGSRVGTVAIYLVAFLFILGSYKVEITPLLTSVGLAGLAIALALQDTLANYFAGIWIQTGRGLQPGHFVRVEGEAVEGGNAVEGFVVDVGWRTTHIRTITNNIVIIPNSKLAQSVITDFHLPQPQIIVQLPFSVGYESDAAEIDRVVLEEVRAVAEGNPIVLLDPPPIVRLVPGFGNFGLEFTLVFQVREFADQFSAQDLIRRRLLDRFRKEGVRIPYPVQEEYAIPPDRPDVATAPRSTKKRPARRKS